VYTIAGSGWVRPALDRRPVHKLRAAIPRRRSLRGARQCKCSLFWLRSARSRPFDPIPLAKAVRAARVRSAAGSQVPLGHPPHRSARGLPLKTFTILASFCQIWCLRSYPQAATWCDACCRRWSAGVHKLRFGHLLLHATRNHLWRGLALILFRWPMQWVRLAQVDGQSISCARRVCWKGAGHCNRSLFWVRSARPIAFDIPAGRRGGSGSGRWRPVHLRSARRDFRRQPAIENVHYFGFVLPNLLSGCPTWCD
jgi:hypothetical protein